MATYTAIIEDSANAFYAVRSAASIGIDHCWLGVEVKRVKGAFIPKAGSRGSKERLVRKECTRLVATLN